MDNSFGLLLLSGTCQSLSDNYKIDSNYLSGTWQIWQTGTK